MEYKTVDFEKMNTIIIEDLTKKYYKIILIILNLNLVLLFEYFINFRIFEFI